MKGRFDASSCAFIDDVALLIVSQCNAHAGCSSCEHKDEPTDRFQFPPFCVTFEPLWAVAAALLPLFRCVFLNERVIAAAGMATIRSKKGMDCKFSEDAELWFKKFVEVVCELFKRSEMDDVMGREDAQVGFE
jgi:hypothetical protein